MSFYGKPDTAETAFAWLQSDAAGESSKTIWFHCMGQRAARPNIPYDSGDFWRCYVLLMNMPSWRARLPEVAATYPMWQPYAQHWDELSALFEEEVHIEGQRMPKLNARLQEIRERGRAAIETKRKQGA